MKRRNFLKLAGAVPVSSLPALARTQTVTLIRDGGPATMAPAVTHAIARLKAALAAQGSKLVVAKQAKGLSVILAPPSLPLVAGFPAATPGWEGPDSFRMAPGTKGLLLSASDVRGFVYGALELAERVAFGGTAGLHLEEPLEEASPNKVRSVARAFLSEVEDKPWFYDREGWKQYLDMLVAARFNRFNLALGFGYDFPKGVTGDYLHFPYPYLVEVPGYAVKITPGLAPGERAKNLKILKFIAREAGARGLDFQLGLWTHAWEWTDSPHSDHVISGLHGWEEGARYSRDALAMLLKECPEISGLTLRVHGESGVPEGTYDFWQTLFEAIAGAGRKIEIDMHAKGINQIMIDMAKKTGQPVKVGPKYSAEHQSLAYHQADIRELEIPKPERMEQGTFAVSNGERRFTRYGYADLYQEDRGFDILYRLWPGTQRHLLSADPAWAAGLGRTANFCGAAGLEICEPLTFKGREGSGHPGGRNAYVGVDDAPDWRKFAESYRLWGRLLYNPAATPDAWRRSFKRRFGDASAAAETALMAASRVLPLLTSAHLPSASNHSLWYEMYTNQPLILQPGQQAPYSDTPKPLTFGACSPLDPQLFSTIDEAAADLLAGRANPKYAPGEVARWLDGLSEKMSKALPQLQRGMTDKALKRLIDDVEIQNCIALFFANKLRAGLAFAIWQQSSSRQAGDIAIQCYDLARQAWVQIIAAAKNVYGADVSYGSTPMRRGHWADRLAAIDADVAAVRSAIAAAPGKDSSDKLLVAAFSPPQRNIAEVQHTPPERFRPGADLPLSVKGAGDAQATLMYRHVNHAERWQSLAMAQEDDGARGAIPASYTNSPYPLQYYFVLRKGSRADLHPGIGPSLSDQPYYAVWKRN